MRRHKITQVTYTLIDTEGHEATIVSGMQLDVPENRAKFPIFQYEVWSPYANGWSSRDLVQRLEQWGYRSCTPLGAAPALMASRCRHTHCRTILCPGAMRRKPRSCFASTHPFSRTRFHMYVCLVSRRRLKNQIRWIRVRNPLEATHSQWLSRQSNICRG